MACTPDGIGQTQDDLYFGRYRTDTGRTASFAALHSQKIKFHNQKAESKTRLRSNSSILPLFILFSSLYCNAHCRLFCLRLSGAVRYDPMPVRYHPGSLPLRYHPVPFGEQHRNLVPVFHSKIRLYISSAISVAKLGLMSCSVVSLS